jgi:hypothetical protein
MLTEDYFLRMINQMLAVLTQILYHKKAGQYQEAQILIDQSLEQLLGIRAALLKQMDDASLLQLLTSQGELDPDRLNMITELYQIEADLLAAQNDAKAAAADYQRALTLVLEIALLVNSPRTNNLDTRIDQLYERISTQELPVELSFQLMDYFEGQGNFERIEQLVSELLKRDDVLQEILPGIIDYYEARLENSDQELFAGGLSRDYVQARLDGARSLFEKG